MSKPRLAVLICMIVAAGASRLIPHPPNFTCITAVALFGGAYLSDRRLAFVVPLAALSLRDLVFGPYPHMEIVYGSFALVVCVGLLLRKKRTPLRVVSATLSSSILFFVITNLGVWAFSSLYPRTLAGLAACYVAAIPFFQNTLAGDALYTATLFGGFALAERLFPALREPASTQPQTA